MAQNTKKTLRNTLFYQVYVRNYSDAGTLKAAESDLPRIKDLGTDILYLLPVHPIGEKNRKGTLGSPYSIQDYRAINPELGTMEDFKDLIEATHQSGMKLMMDIVFNHTSYDSWLFEHHKEWFYQNEAGEYTNRVADWWDITDFDYGKDKALYDYLIETLVMYTEMGVDGFRFDVANILPLDFLEAARNKVLAVNPDSIWLSETTHGHFTKTIRDEGFDALSEGEIYRVFDMSYDYDAHPFFEGFLKGEKPLQAYIDFLNLQEEIYPANYIKMRNLENHDFGRVAGMVKDPDALKAWHAFSFFARGSAMIYMGGEFSDPKHPDLFDKDVMDRTGEDLTSWIQPLRKLLAHPLVINGALTYQKAEGKDVIVTEYTNKTSQLIGIFNVSNATGDIPVNLPDGTYNDLLHQGNLVVKNGLISLPKTAVVIER